MHEKEKTEDKKQTTNNHGWITLKVVSLLGILKEEITDSLHIRHQPSPLAQSPSLSPWVEYLDLRKGFYAKKFPPYWISQLNEIRETCNFSPELEATLIFLLKNLQWNVCKNFVPGHGK